MGAGFTPGPWFIHSSGRRANETALSIFEIGHGTNSYGDGPEGIVARLEGVSETDARLMVAAPTLYEALAELDEQLLFDKPVSGTGAAAFAKARAALALARRMVK